jgi:hypothetical protein
VHTVKRFIRIFVVSVLFAFCALSLNGCSGGPGGDSWRYDPGIPGQVTGLKAEPGSNLVTFSWTGNPVATSYRVYYVSELTETRVTKTNGNVINTTFTSMVIRGLDNNIKYHFMVTALNRDGESVESIQVSATPGPISNATLAGTWYFHTLVTGPDAKWEQGTMTVTMDANGVCSAAISDFQDSVHFNPDDPSVTIAPPPDFGISVGGDGIVSKPEDGVWPYFHGTMGSRKNMMVATWSPSLTSRAITIFQRKKADSDPDYTIEDIAGTGSGQNPNNPYIQGNGPTRFAYHQLYSGSNTEWEYGNGKVGKKGQFQVDVKDIIYWDYATPTYKVDTGIDILTKATGFGMDKDGLVTEYWNYANVADPVKSPSFNYLVPRKPYDEVFTGRMTADKTVVVGVATRTDVNGANPQYFLRIMELCFIPTDQASPIYSLTDLAGDYKFHKISSSVNSPFSGYGVMSIISSGLTSFSNYVDDVSGPSAFPDTFQLVYYSDPGAKAYSDFANFVTSDPEAGGSHYYYNNDINRPYHTYYNFYNDPNTTLDDYIDINNPLTWPEKAISKYYYNEHGSLSYNKDLFVLTRTDSSGNNSLVIGLK